MFFGSIWRNISLGFADEKTKMLSYIWLIAFFISFPIISILAYNKDYGNGETAISYIISYSSGILLFLLLSTKSKITFYPCVYLGSISYSVYLIHPFSLSIAVYTTSMSDHFSAFIFLIYIFFTLLSSSLCFNFVEKPFIKLRSKLKFNQL